MGNWSSVSKLNTSLSFLFGFLYFLGDTWEVVVVCSDKEPSYLTLLFSTCIELHGNNGKKTDAALNFTALSSIDPFFVVLYILELDQNKLILLGILKQNIGST